MLKKMSLKIITKIQKILLKSQREIAVDLYYRLAKLHFRIYFGKSLEEEILQDSVIGYRAAMRHSRLVVKVLYSNSSGTARKIAKLSSRASFIKNILLEVKL